jgi:ferredoxin-thioredoxin reductase catalytic subunit
MKYLIKKGWILNPNEKIVKGITKAIERNEGKCPCVHDSEEYEGKSLICPCSDYIKKDICCCNLYIKNK